MADVDMGDAAENDPLFEAVPNGDTMEGVEIQEAPSVAKDAEVKDQAAAALAGTYTWVITNWSQRTDPKVYSDKFEIGTYIWRMLIFPRGNNSKHLSVYLDAPEASWMPANLTPKASFKLVMINHRDPAGDFVKDTMHTFTANETDWGFTQFIPLEDMDKGFISPSDEVHLRVELRVERDERWSYDSRAETGHVGLKNQGATCYMNSLLQYLFHVPLFRKAVYHMPTEENDETSASIPLALQSLFFRLQYSRTPPGTKDLTKSFGWSSSDALYQHDVQELNRVLCEKLEEKMKGTRVEKVIAELFEGRVHSYVKCVHIPFESTRVEPFMDLALNVRGCKDVYASFDKLTEQEKLEGENQYQAEGHGLQDAVKGMLLQDLPPVLQLQLKRFDYDYTRDTMVKINDRYEFPEELDLDRDNGKYLAPDADRSQPNQYKLLAVLVHSGGVHGGHYYAYIRPDGTTWLKFDDERVTIETTHKAVQDNFGGEGGAPEGAAAAAADGAAPLQPLGSLAAGGGGGGGGGVAPPPGLWRYTRFSNAYMLVYVRLCQWDHVMSSVTKEDIAQHLRDRLEAEQRDKERRQKEKQEAHLYCHVRLARDADIAAQIGSSHFFDLVDYDAPGPTAFRVRKHTRFSDFKEMVAAQLGVPVAQQRYWVWQRRQNSTYRPARRLRPEEEAMQLMDLRDLRETAGPTSKAALMDLKLFLEAPTSPGAALYAPLRTDILLFLKHYDPAGNGGSGCLSYCGFLYAPKAARMVDLFPLLAKRAGLPEGTQLEAYEEIKFEPTVMVEPIATSAVLSAPPTSLEDGDIVCFQAAVGPGEEGRHRHPRVKDFLAFIRNRKKVTFKRLEAPGEEGLELELLRDMEYDDVTGALAERLGVSDPTTLRLTQQSHYSGQPQRAPVRFRHAVRLDTLTTHAGHPVPVLYYEVLDIPLPQLEQLKALRVGWHGQGGALLAEHALRVPRDSRVADVLEELRKRLGPEQQDATLRLLEVYQSRIYKVFEPSDDISSVNEQYWQLRAEAVAPGEREEDLADGGRLLHCYHIAAPREPPSSSAQAPAAAAAAPGIAPPTPPPAGLPPPPPPAPAAPPPAPVVFGDPLLLAVGPAEPLSSVKARLRARLGVAGDEEWAKWRFCFVPPRGQPEYLADADVPALRFAKAAAHASSEGAYLGMEHESRGAKRGHAGGQRSGYGLERGIKINN